MYEVLCTRDWGPALITDLEHEGLNAKQRSLGSMEKEEKPLKVVEREGQQGKGSRLGAPLPTLLLTARSAYGFSEALEPTDSWDWQPRDPLPGVALLPDVSFCLGPTGGLSTHSSSSQQLRYWQKDCQGKAITKQQVPERKDGMGIYSYCDSGILSTSMSLVSHCLTLFLCHCSSISRPQTHLHLLSPQAAAITTPSL